MATFKGTAGDDDITGTSGNDKFNLSQGGNDSASGGDGNDAFTMGATLNAGDHIDGGAGIDTVNLNGDYSAGLVFDATTITGIEKLHLYANFSYDLVMNDGNVAAGETLAVNATAMNAADHLIFDGSAETDGSFSITAGAGNDTLSGGAQKDVFNLSQGGDDIVHAGAGNDVISAGSQLTAADRIDGGDGVDTLVLDGNYVGVNAVTLSATTITNIEAIKFTAGRSYSITTDDATVAAGATLSVDGNALTANILTFNGAAESDGHFAFTGGAGNDALTGGAQSDTFNLSLGGNDNAQGGGGNDTFTLGAALTASDKIDGGTGTDVVSLNGDYSAGVVFAAATMVNVETLQFTATHSYNLTTNDANLASGAVLTVDASKLGAGDVLTFNGAAETNGSFAFIGGAGNDTLTGGAQADTFLMTAGGSDTAHGGSGNDTFTLGATLTSADQIDGGSGSDTLILNGDYSAGLVLGAATMTNIEALVLSAGRSYTLTTDDANVTAGQTLTVDAGALAAKNALVFNGGAESDGMLAIIGGAGSDNLTGGAQADNFDLSHGGNDTASGGGGNDVFTMGGALTAADRIDGGAGTDTLALNGDYSAGLTFAAATMANVETLQLAAGHGYGLTLNDANVASGQSLTVDASALGAGDLFTFNGAAETDGSFVLVGGAGNDTLTGGAQADSFDLTHGGADTAHGGSGNDTFTLGGALGAADAIDGGAGIDTLVLNGDYSAGLTLGTATITNVETLQFAAGHGYNISTSDATVASGQTLTVDGSALGAGDTLIFSGSAETNGAFAFVAGAGNDVLTGGALADSFDLTRGGNDTAHGGGGNDVFNLGAALTAADAIDGGTGTDTLVLNGDYSAGVVLGATTITGIETVQFAAGHSYNLTANDGNVAAGQTLTVDGSALGAADALTFNGGAETNGSFAFVGGAGSDVLTGGASADSFDLTLGGGDTAHGGGGNDTFTLGAAFSASDAIDGGTGSDTLLLNGDYSAGVTFAAATITGIETIQLAANHSYVFTSNDANVASGQTLTVDGSALGDGDTLNFNGGAETDGSFAFIAGTGINNLTGGAQADTFDMTRVDGSAVIHGGGGNDTFNFGAVYTGGVATIDGGVGNDTLVLNGDYSAGVLFAPSALTSVETLQLGAGHSYSFQTNDSDIAASATFTVDGSALGAGDTLFFDGSPELDGSFAFTGGAGSDTLTGGAVNDTFNLTKGGTDVAHGGGGNDTFTMGAALTAADTIDGGLGSDTVTLNGDYSAGLVLGATTLTGIETLQFAAGHGYNLTTNDATVASGATLTVDASALGAGDGLSFDGSAELDGSFAFTAGAGNVTLIGGAQADSFTMGATLAASDQINGGAGSDKLILNGDYSAGVVFGASTVVNVETLQLLAGHSYNLTTNDATVASGQTFNVDGSTLGASDVLTFNGGAELDGAFTIVAGAGNDVLTGGAQADSFDLTKGGNDIAHGGGGNDTFTLGATLTASDQIDGGAGSDTLSLNGAYSLTFGAATITGIELMQLAAGHGYTLTTNDGNVASSQTLTVDGSALGAGDVLTFNGGAETDGSFAIAGGAANDVLTGGAQADSFDLSKGGNDNVHGGAGNDTFTLGAAFTASDQIDGGVGNDTLTLSGGATVTFTTTTITSVETLQLGGGNYSLTLNDANVASGTILTVDGSLIGSGHTFTFNGSAETNGAFAITGGEGNDTLTGGAGNDSFDLTLGGLDTVSGGSGNDTFNFGNTFTTTESIDGGAGNDTLILNGDSYTSEFDFQNMVNVETIQLGAGHSYFLVTNDQAVASGATLTVDGSALGASDVLHFYGGAETNGSFLIIGGAGNDILNGGNGSHADTFDLTHGGNDTVTGGGLNIYLMGAALNAADSINGPGTVVLNGDYSAGLVLGATTLMNIHGMQFLAGHNYNITAADATIANSSFKLDSSALGAADSLIFDASADTNGGILFTGGAGSTTIDVGTRFWNGTFVGGAGKDTLVFDGSGYSGPEVIQSFNATNIDGLTFVAGHSYYFDISDNVFTSNATAFIDGSALGASDKLTFHGDSNFGVSYNVIAGAGDDNISALGTVDLTHGGNDTCGGTTVLMGGTLTTADAITAGRLVLDGDYSAGVVFGATTVTNTLIIQLDGGHSYNLTTNDATVASGKTLTVDASALGASDVLIFGGASETNGTFSITAGAGDDQVTGGAGADTFDMTHGGSDFVQGLGGNDTFNFSATLTASDMIDGGTGTDTLNLAGDYSAGLTFGATTITSIETIKLTTGFSYNLTMADGDVAGGTTLTVDGSALAGANVLVFDGSAETDGKFIIKGGAGNDVLTGSAGNDSFDLSGGGNDTAHGGGGNDFFSFSSNFTGADTVDGGAGNDTISMSAFNATSVTLSATSMVSVETFQIGGAAYNVTFNDANVLAGQTLAIDTSGDSSGGTLDLSADTDSFFTINSGTGNDTVVLGADFRVTDTFNGNSGTDTLSLAGDYSAGLVLGATTITNVETVQLGGGFSYNITTNDGNLTAAQTLKFDASALGAADVFTFNGSAEASGSYNVIGGAGNDVLTGGGGNDTFDLTHGGSDTVHGGGGNDTFVLGASYVPSNFSIDGGVGTDTLSINGEYTGGQALTLSGAFMTSVEDVLLGAGHSYNITTGDNFVAAGITLVIDGGTNAINVLTFDGSAETDGMFNVTGGAGNDVLTGGALADTFDISKGGVDTVHGGGGDDTIQAGAQFATTDVIDGGAGNDTLLFSNGYSGTLSNVSNVEKITVTTSSASLTPLDSVVAAGQTLTVDASGAPFLTFNGANETDGHFYLIGGAGNDALTGGGQSDTFDLTHGGEDTVHGGGGDDIIYIGATWDASGDALDGGAGNDTLVLNGFYNISFGLQSLTSIETLLMTPGGGRYSIALNDSNVAAGATLTVDGSQLVASDIFSFSSGDTNSFFHFVGGASTSQNLTGAALADTFDMTHATSYTVDGGSGGDDLFLLGANYKTSGEQIFGGSGTDNDTVNFTGNYSAGVTFANNFTSIETMTFGAGFTYKFTTVDANVASGATLTVDASALTTTALTFNGIAETNGSFAFIGGGGNDVLTGGALADTFDLSYGGNDTVVAANGNDTVNMGSALTAADTLDGGSGIDTLTLNGDYSAGLTFLSTTALNFETIRVAAGHSYNLTTNNATVVGGVTMTVDGSALGASDSFAFNGAAETDGKFAMTGGAGNDTLTGGVLADSFDLSHGGTDVVTGGGGGDTITAFAAGGDSFVYKAVSDSTSTQYDTIVHANFDADFFNVSTIGAVTGVDAAVTTGALSTASFDGDLAAAVGAGQLAAHHALLFTADSGTLSGHTFLVIDENGTAGYQAGADLVIDVTSAAGTLTASDFI